MIRIFQLIGLFLIFLTISINTFAQAAPNYGWPVRTDQIGNSLHRGRINGTPGEHRAPYTGVSIPILVQC